MKAPNWIKCASETIAGGCLLLSLINCNGEITTTDNLKTLETEVADPSAEYRTAPLSVWNNKMTESEVERTIKELKDAGFGGLFVHPRPGLITEYMSDEWYSLYQHAIDYGKETGMYVWIYDENSYPSG